MRWRAGIVLVLLAGCTGSPDLVRNGGFESEGEWFWFEESEHWVAPFERNATIVRSGDWALRTHLQSNSSHSATAIVGAIQEVPASRAGHHLPGMLTGAYFVDGWETDAQRAYLQVVFSFVPREDARQWCPGLTDFRCQLAIILAGQDERPFPIANRVFVLPADAHVPVGEWVPFEYDVRSLMGQAWGVEHLDYDHFWMYLEARYETEGARQVDLDVRWDDIVLRT